MGDNVERLLLLGGASINGTGNTLSNTLLGNSGANILNGYSGTDTMQGGGGNDTYIVDSAGDIVVESADAGFDTVHSTLDHGLPANLERLLLLNSANINGAGNSADNTLLGNSGNNTLNGAYGNDVLTGNGGADNFWFASGLSSTGNVDTITDFTSGTDKIWLLQAVFSSYGKGEIAADTLQFGTAAADTNDYLIYNEATGCLYYDQDGSGSGNAVLFAYVGTSSHPSLAATDFLIV